MMPWQRAKKWQLENSEVAFEEVLGTYMMNGLVHSTDDVFILARQAEWKDGAMYSGKIKPNTWFVQLAAGDMSKFLKVAPRKLRYVAWQRHGSQRYHVWPSRKFAKMVRRKIKWDQPQ
tara:strand:+ start:465 stop:818 length:354 start_codon:yes stop_codon:yes gene_type:complete